MNATLSWVGVKIPNFLSALIEYILLFRNPISGYGQTPRANLRIFSAIWTSTLIFIGIYLLHPFLFKSASTLDFFISSKMDLSDGYPEWLLTWWTQFSHLE